MSAISQAIRESLAAPQQIPHCQMIDVVREYGETSQLLAGTTDPHGRQFYGMALRQLQAELCAMAPDENADVEDR